MSALSLHDDSDGPPNIPPSEPHATAPSRRAAAIEFASGLSHNPELAGKVMRDLLVLASLEDATGAIHAARNAISSGNREAFQVELNMALRCLRDARDTETD